MGTRRTVQKEIRWEAAHRLVKGYTGKCAHNHGHSWVARVVVELRPEGALNAFDFVRDFADFQAVKQWVDEHWDHATLVSEGDEALLRWLRENGQRHYVFPANPTSEVIAETLFHIASRMLNDERCRVRRVEVNETCTSAAVYEEAG